MITNKLEIRVVALKRTGHHAIIEWMLDGISGKRVFINNSRPGKAIFNPEWILKRPDYRLVTRDFDDYDLSADVSGAFMQKEAMIYNYENWPLTTVFPSDLDARRVELVGESETRIDMIICRDPLNNAASYLKKTSHKHSLAEYEQWMALWCDYAEVAMNEQTPAGRPIFPVHYSLWLTGSDYRAWIAKKMGIENRPMPQKTAKWGDGSSFAPGQINENAIDANALKLRWLEVRDDPTYRHMFSHPRVIEISRKYLRQIDEKQNLENFESFVATLKPRLGTAKLTAPN